MRELKFRVWDNENKSYDDPYSYAYYALTQDGGLDFYCHGDHMNEADPDVYFIEQYTGLKDKNGKEIYEGDMVNLEYYEKPRGKKRWSKINLTKDGKDINVVGFEDGYFKFYEEDKDGYGSALAFSYYGWWESADKEYKYVAEVIGNIHENPELLGGEE